MKIIKKAFKQLIFNKIKNKSPKNTLYIKNNNHFMTGKNNEERNKPKTGYPKRGGKTT